MAVLPKWKGLKVSKPNKLAAINLSLPTNVIKPKNALEAHKWVLSRVRYVRDVGDEWQSPRKTLARGKGDCEDFCILEYALLKRAGFSPELLIVRDLVTKEDHALLVVGDVFLDNRSKEPIPLTRFNDFRPIFGYTDKSVYLYGRTE